MLGLAATATALTASWLARAKLLHWVDVAVSAAQGQPARRARNPYLGLEHNFAPVDQETHAPAKVVAGALPPALAGVFARIGPNPALPPSGDYHWFDGDGMVHAVRITPAGDATYCNRWVQTSRLAAERKAGVPLFTKFGDYRGGWALLHMAVSAARALVGLKPRGELMDGTANTALAFHASRLLALHEGSLPHQLRVACDGVVSTIGRVFAGEVRHPFTAHPKVDPADGSMHALGYRLDKKPYLWYMQVDKAGTLVADVAIDTGAPTMQHDCAIAGPFFIFVDPPLVFKPDVMVASAAKMPFVYDTDKPLRIGLLRKGAPAGDDTRWFELPACMIFHTATAWVEQGGDVVKLFACCFESFDLDLDAGVAGKAAFDGFARPCVIELNLKTGAASRRRLTDTAGDFPVVPAATLGSQTRYAYVAAANVTLGVPLFDGVAKIDLMAAPGTDATVARLAHGPGRHGGEAVFVPDPKRAGQVDGGFLVTYVHETGKNESEMVVYDAATMASAPVARVALPARVPHGFHAVHVSEAELAAQDAAPREE